MEWDASEDVIGRLGLKNKFDTNILIGAVITKDTPPDRLYQAWLGGEFELVTSTVQVRELVDVLSRQRLQRFVDADEAMAIVEHIGTHAVILDELPSVSLSPDPADDRILAAAIYGDVDLIVSGDKKHMLALRDADGIPIVTARCAVERRVFLAGANPAQQLSLRLVAARAGYGGNDMV